MLVLFEISLSDLSKKLFAKFASLNMAVVNGVYFHYTDW